MESVDQLRSEIINNPKHFTSIPSFNNNIRSTSAYWYTRSRELLEMVEQIGPPTIFMTLSAADLYWPDLYQILDPDYNYDAIRIESAFLRRRRLLNENPMIVAYFFHQRLNSFLEKFFYKTFAVENFWFRIEFQHRGSPHMHGLFWLKDAPDMHKLKDTDVDKIKSVVEYFNILISTWHPNPNETYDYHPSFYRYSDVLNKDADYNHLLRAVQMHTCRNNYCMRKERGSNRFVCRFKYPKDICHESTISFLDGVPEFVPKRNSTNLNAHNPSVLSVWRANIDCQAVTSTRAVLNYIAKYASKSESKSSSLMDFFTNAIQSTKPGDNMKQVVQKILLKMCAERDYSAQEIFWVVMGWPFYKTSKQFTVINLSESAWDKVVLDTENENSAFINKCPLKNYAQRPSQFESMSLKEFCTSVYTVKGRFVVRRKPTLLRVYPKLQYDENGNNEKYFKLHVVVNVPWRNIDQLKTEESTWQTIYNQHFGPEIVPPHNLRDLLQSIEEENCEDITNDEVETTDWMLVAGGPHHQTQPVCLGFRQIDITAQWETINEKEEIEKIKTFIENSKQQYGNEEETTYNDV